MSSTFCDDGNQEIAMVVEDQTTVNDPGMISQANPVETGIFILEDGKVLTLSRKSSPGKNCVSEGQPCGVLDHCCDGLYCDGYAWGTCSTTFCIRTGLPCVGPVAEDCCSKACFGFVCA